MVNSESMNDGESRRCWDDNADVWTTLSRAGFDVYRDGFNTPAFLAMLPDVAGRHGLDLGCGEGHNTRLLAGRGARMTAVDISGVFLRHAQARERERSVGIHYVHASARSLPFAEAAFDFATAFMSLMDMPEVERVVAEAHRVLRPGGFLQVSIEHPCFATPHRRQLRTADGVTYAFEIGEYFRRIEGDPEEWIFSAAPPELRAGMRAFRIPRFTRPLSAWLNLLIDAGFTIERCGEPRPSDEVVRQYPKLQDAQVVAYFLHLRARKHR